MLQGYVRPALQSDHKNKRAYVDKANTLSTRFSTARGGPKAEEEGLLEPAQVSKNRGLAPFYSRVTGSVRSKPLKWPADRGGGGQEA